MPIHDEELKRMMTVVGRIVKEFFSRESAPMLSRIDQLERTLHEMRETLVRLQREGQLESELRDAREEVAQLRAQE